MMHLPPRTAHRRGSQRGQTLVVSLMILGILLVLGFVFLGIINRNIVTSGRMQGRSVATDLAEAGIRYAHAQLLHSELGADWRGAFTTIVTDANGFTRDPDALYLRQATNYGLRSDTDNVVDLGGPDGLGPYTRVNYSNGRAIVRVRYSPSDINVFYGAPTGALRNAGRARNYLIIEAIGRPGRITPNDPSSFPPVNVRVQGYASSAEFRQELEKMRRNDQQFTVTSKKVMAFASLGLIETARFITNVHRVNRPAELGFPADTGATFGGAAVMVPVLVGTSLPMFNFVTPANPNLTPSGSPVPGFGSIWVNGNLEIHGNLGVNLNSPLGDLLAVAGTISGADGAAVLRLTRATADRTSGLWQAPAIFNLANGTNPSLDSRSPFFSTHGGVVRDAIDSPDAAGYSRLVAYKAPPSIQTVDPETKLTRYVLSTRESGFLGAGGNSGLYGHGRGVYVNNFGDRQTPPDESGRQTAGTDETLVYDWLNPNNGLINSGWQGPFYVPRGAYVQLMRDGWTIYRDGRGPPAERTWRSPTGVDTGSSVCRFRVGANSRGDRAVVNSFTPGVNINGGLGAADFDRGQPFSGVLYFEGNVRVRGIIPTDVQLTLVSNATIYVEGSITKGVFSSGGTRLTRPSMSTLMLMARDNVALNTTQFFGTAPQAGLEEVSDVPSGVAYQPVRMRVANGAIPLRTEVLLDPLSSAAPANPSTWSAYAANYTPFGSPPSTVLPTKWLVTHTMDDGPAANSFISLDINYGLGTPIDSTYLFPSNFHASVAGTAYNNAASPYFGPGYVTPGFTQQDYVNIYGLGAEPWQRYSKFETIGFPLIRPDQLTQSAADIRSTGNEGQYRFLLQETNDLTVRPNNIGGSPTNDYLLARAAMIPHDVRIEASMYAEEGSFFVIPGHWFNPNPNDRRTEYERNVASYVTGGMSQQQARAQADRDRLDDYGTFPETPFYGEPIDVRIQVVGSVSENMPPPIAQQSEWLRKWGWIPGQQGATGVNIPSSHVPQGWDLNTTPYVPNLIISYDPVLATGRVNGFSNAGTTDVVRLDRFGRPLPPMPRLPVSPTLAYFGEVNP